MKEFLIRANQEKSVLAAIGMQSSAGMNRSGCLTQFEALASAPAQPVTIRIGKSVQFRADMQSSLEKVGAMFRVREPGGDTLYKDAVKPEALGDPTAVFERLVIADVWEIDMDRAFISMGDRAKLIHGLPLTEAEFGLGTFLAAYESGQSGRIAELIDHSIETGTPFCYVAELADQRKGPVMGIGEIAGGKLTGTFLAVRFPTQCHIRSVR